MPNPGDVLDLSPIGALFHVRKTGRETDGQSLEMEWVLAPHSAGTPIHIHPSATESYEVLEGKLDVYIDGTWTTLSSGQSASVNPGVPHTFRNAADTPTRVYNTHSPAMQFEEYFGSIDRVVRGGVVPSDRMTLKTILYLSLLMTSYEAEIRSVRPPQAVMKGLAAFARVLGLRVPRAA